MPQTTRQLDLKIGQFDKNKAFNHLTQIGARFPITAIHINFYKQEKLNFQALNFSATWAGQCHDFLIG